MTELNYFLIISYSFLTAFSLISMWSIKRANPVFWYIVFQWLIAIGTFVVADLSRPTDLLYCSLFFIALITFYTSSRMAMLQFGVNRKVRRFFGAVIEEDGGAVKIAIYMVALLSLVISLLYYQVIGYNLFSDVVLGKDIVDFKTSRLATYSGENYYAPGYVNQFKNVLLPVSLFVICLWLWKGSRRILFYCFTGFTIAICLYVLLGTGQRAPFVYSFVTFLFGLTTIARFKLGWLIIASIVLVFLFGLFSVLNGRAEELDPLTMIESFLTRLFVNDQQEGLWGFRHVLNFEFAWFSDWWLGFMGILPGHKGSPLAHDLYYLLHGTTRGTSGLTTVGSVYYNGGILAIINFYFLLGYLYSFVYNRLLSGRRTVLRGMTYGGMIFIMSVFVSGAPVVLINKGVLAFLLLLLIRKLFISYAKKANVCRQL